MVVIEREPKICAITCSFTFNEKLDYNTLEAKVCEAFDAYDESGVFVYPKKKTKVKSQLHIPLELEVAGRKVFYRCRYERYVSRNGELRSNFLNQTCFYYKTEANKNRCFKFFRNGKVHVTGFNDLDDMDNTVKEFYGKLTELVTDKVVVPTVEMRTLHMVNMTMKFKANFRMEVLSMHFQKPEFGLHVHFEAELYVGMILTAPDFKFLVFRSGSVIITGTKSVEKAMEGYSRLLQLLESAERANLLKDTQSLITHLH